MRTRFEEAFEVPFGSSCHVKNGIPNNNSQKKKVVLTEVGFEPTPFRTRLVAIAA